MYTYIERTPDLCRKIAEGAADRVAGLVGQFTLRPRTRLLIVASGSSYNIAVAAKPYLQRVLGIEVTVTWPMSYILFDHAQALGTFVLCMSQSGKSTNTIEAVRRARECGQDVAVLTCNGNAPIREVCEHVYEYGSGVEDYYVAKGFPTSCTFLFEFAIAVARALGTGDEMCIRDRGLSARGAHAAGGTDPSLGGEREGGSAARPARGAHAKRDAESEKGGEA